jgi:hypothetical protein
MLPDSITGTVTLRRGSATNTRAEFLTERELEDAVTPHLTRPRELYLVFKEHAGEMVKQLEERVSSRIDKVLDHLPLYQSGSFRVVRSL